jgi:CheY-like chemotaxis protein
MIRRVLLVEDDAAVRGVLAQELRDAGTAARAIGLARDAGRVDCVIADVFLPDMLGTDLVLRLRAFGGPRVIFTTAYVREAAALVQAGVPKDAHLLEKPFTIAALLAAIAD